MKHRYITTLVKLSLVAVMLLTSIVPISAQEEAPIRIIFMHHSTGLGIIQDGNVRQGFASLGYEFWDHGYNEEGLAGPDGNYMQVWDVLNDNTDPDGWYDIFGQPYTSPPANTLSHMLEYDVIIFKSCFPSANIDSEERFDEYMMYYDRIRATIAQHPDKLFIPWTPPPLVPNETTPEAAARAQRWTEYLTSEEFSGGYPNITVFDIYSLLSDEQGFLRAEYRSDEWDSHPNTVANQMVGPILVEFVSEAIQNFEPGEPVAVAQPADAAEADSGDSGEMPAASGEPLVAGAMIEDFEMGADILSMAWWSDGALALDMAGESYDGEYAIQVQFDLALDEYVSFGRDDGSVRDWSAASGISFYWRANTPDLVVTLGLFIASESGLIPYEVLLPSPSAEWTQVTVAWDEFRVAEWSDVSGPDIPDVIVVQGIGFGLGDWENTQTGTLYLDNIALIGE